MLDRPYFQSVARSLRRLESQDLRSRRLLAYFVGLSALSLTIDLITGHGDPENKHLVLLIVVSIGLIKSALIYIFVWEIILILSIDGNKNKSNLVLSIINSKSSFIYYLFILPIATIPTIFLAYLVGPLVDWMAGENRLQYLSMVALASSVFVPIFRGVLEFLIYVTFGLPLLFLIPANALNERLSASEVWSLTRRHGLRSALVILGVVGPAYLLVTPYLGVVVFLLPEALNTVLNEIYNCLFWLLIAAAMSVAYQETMESERARLAETEPGALTAS